MSLLIRPSIKDNVKLMTSKDKPMNSTTIQSLFA